MSRRFYFDSWALFPAVFQMHFPPFAIAYFQGNTGKTIKKELPFAFSQCDRKICGKFICRSDI